VVQGNRGWIDLCREPIGAVVVMSLCALLAACTADETSGDPSTNATVGSPVSGAQAAGSGGTGGQQVSMSPASAAGGSASIGTGGSASPVVANGGSGGAASSGSAGQPGQVAGSGGIAAGSGGMTGATGTGGSMSSGALGEICTRWKADRANLAEGTWSGNAAACDAGDLTADARENAHRLHSLYRFMAGLDPVEMTDEGNRLAQGCALLMTANGMLSHMPDSSWKCYTDEASKTAGSSSLSPGSSVSSVDGYMIDPGNPTTLGHRRWILSSMLAGVGFGSSGSFSCQYQPPQRPAPGAKPWVAWPAPGQIPIQAFGSGFSKLDQTGWSVQSDTIDFQSAQVKVTSAGMDLAVTVTPLSGGYGSLYAMRFNAMGWTAAAGQTYHVAISGASMPIEYDVEVVDCP
jgi:hypothetical protein